MASNLSNGTIASAGYTPVVKLPEHVDGFIDLEILVDIHTYLSESEKGEDIELAAWVKEHYLQKPLVEIGRPIQDAEGFVNLDKAYRRVRQLTGKAQDKWPFYDKNWKKMSSTVVKNAMLGKGAMSMTLPETDGQVRDTPMSNGFDSRHDDSPQVSKLQIPSRTDNPGDYQTQEHKSPQPADPSLTDRQKTEQKAHLQAPDHTHTSTTSNATGLAATNGNIGAPGVDGMANGTVSPGDEMRDAGAGKVRGPHGRYVNKNGPSLAAKKGPNIKYVKRSRARAALESENEEDNTSSDKVTEVFQNPLKTASTSTDGNNVIVQSGNGPRMNLQSANTMFNAFHSSGSAILAAEAEAVPSNLDRLPPVFAYKKRKSESSIQRGDLKRARGSRGGVLGRPRKSELPSEHSQSEPGEGFEVEQALSQPETPAKTPTRQSSRKSAASALESSTPWDPAADVLLNEVGKKQPAKNDTSTTVNGADAAFNGDHRPTETLATVDSKTKQILKQPANSTLFTISTDTPSNQRLKTQKTPTLVKQKKRVSFSPEVQADNVEFFARISTSVGIQEVPLLEEDLTSEVGLVKRYAEWQNAGNANVTFDVFKDIVKFAR